MERKNSILEGFCAEMKRRCVRLHGAVLMSGGEIIDECYLPPYTAGTKTRMYSASKSVTAVAIGKLVGEKRLSLDDKITDIFSGRLDMRNAPALLREQTIRQMLTMTTVYSAPTYSEKNRDWLASYFRGTATHPAGTLWYYDSCGSYVLGAVVKELTGKDFVEYLRPEFDLMGVSPDVYCLKGPDGEAWASSGFMATTADLARIAYLLLNGGAWSGRQLIPRDYARDAISCLVRTEETGKISPYSCGYGYQIWGHPDGAFAFRGLGGQVAIGFPGRDLVFACNCDTAANADTYDDIFRAVEDTVLPRFPVTDGAAYVAAQPKTAEKNVFGEICGVRWRMEENPMGIEEIAFRETGEGQELFYVRSGKKYRLAFSDKGEIRTVFPEAYTGSPLFDGAGFMQYRCSVEVKWLAENKLLLRVWAEDLYVGNMTAVFCFQGDRIAVAMAKRAQFFFTGLEGYGWGTRI